MRISKSSYMDGLRCSKLLYLSKHHPELASPESASSRKRFEDGHRVGIEAHALFPDSISVFGEWTADGKALTNALKDTGNRLTAGAGCLLEASFAVDDLYARCDVIDRISERGERDAWHLIEVKSSTKVKPEHIDDLAFQQVVASNAGLAVEKTSLFHLNNEYVHSGGKYDAASLFTQQEVTQDVNESIPSVLPRLKAQRGVMAATECPEVATGSHCNDPYPCPFYAHCHREQHRHDINFLPSISRKKVAELQARGIRTIGEVPEGEITAGQWRTWATVRRQVPPLDGNVWDALKGLAYPIHCLDFEAMLEALPLYAGTRPYQKVPFQWSCHIIAQPGADPGHRDFLHTGASDPRADFVKELWDCVKDAGTIVVYSGFESQALADLARNGIDGADELYSHFQSHSLDLYRVLKANCYHSGFRGSWSLKTVVDTFGLKVNYEDSAIKDGEAAIIAYLRMLESEDQLERSNLEQSLRTYCGIDTATMMALVRLLADV